MTIWEKMLCSKDIDEPFISQEEIDHDNAANELDTLPDDWDCSPAGPVS
jgi:hypothetical protein